MYNKKQIQIKKDNRFKKNKINIEIKINFAKKTEKKINEFYNKIIKKYCKTIYIVDYL